MKNIDERKKKGLYAVAGGHFADDEEEVNYLKIKFYCDACRENTMEMTIREDELESSKNLVGFCPKCGKHGCHYNGV